MRRSAEPGAEIANVCRKTAKAVAEGKPTPITVTAENLHDYLGKPRSLRGDGR